MQPLRKIKHLHEIVNTIFKRAYAQGLTTDKLCDETGLCPQTIKNLAASETMYPRLQTVYLLAQAVGLQLQLHVVRVSHRKAG